MCAVKISREAFRPESKEKAVEKHLCCVADGGVGVVAGGQRGSAWWSCHHMASLSSQHSAPHETAQSDPTSSGMSPPPDGWWWLLLMSETKHCQCRSTLLIKPGQEEHKLFLIGSVHRWEIISSQICKKDWLSHLFTSTRFSTAYSFSWRPSLLLHSLFFWRVHPTWRSCGSTLSSLWVSALLFFFFFP